MADDIKTDPTVTIADAITETIAAIPVGNTPIEVVAALKNAGWTQVDGKNWKRGDGITPMPWSEALLVVSTQTVTVVPYKSGIKTTEFWMAASVIAASLGSAAAVMGDHVEVLPPAQRPLASLVLMGLAAGSASLYAALRVVAKTKAE